MAGGASHAHVRARQGETGSAVIEGRGLPGGGGVANLASRRDSRLRVVGVGRPLEIGHVASRADRIGGRQIVVVVDMTGEASHVHVRTRQGEAGSAVIEGRGLPSRGGVAGLAGGREIGLYVVWVGGVLEIGHVAGRAGGVRRRQVVVVVYMAGRAGHGDMGPCQR